MSFRCWKSTEFAWSGSHVIWGWGQNIEFWTYFTICMPLISGFGLGCVCSFISCARELQIPKFDRIIIDCIFSCYKFLENWTFKTICLLDILEWRQRQFSNHLTLKYCRSTSPLGWNHVDGLPPALSWRVDNTRLFASLGGLIFKFFLVTKLVHNHRS